MKKITIKKTTIIITIVTFMSLLFTGCTEEWLNLQPTSEMSDATFWKNENDAYLGLVGVYNASSGRGIDNTLRHFHLQGLTDVSIAKEATQNWETWFAVENTGFVYELWKRSYKAITRCNVFLENIRDIDMSPEKKAEYIAEVRFIRAYQYFWFSQLWGGVPLITEVLTISEANSISRNSKQQIVDFVLTELTEAMPNLPISRPTSEGRRHLRSAALTIKGRLLMAEERWSEAASTFKEIIDLGVHEIDDRFREIFQELGQVDTKEIIYAHERIADIYGQDFYQRRITSEMIGGFSIYNATQSVVDAFPMVDGLSIDESPLYDSDNPFVNRDPRLKYSILRHGDVWEGRVIDKINDPTGIQRQPGRTGYGCIKFTQEYFTGSITSSGADLVYIRYAEVLLAYLESRLEAGDNITQDLLDQTINKIRGRASVNIGPVTETNRDLLREIVRNERKIELLWEPYIRYWDIIRWKIGNQAFLGPVYGMKLTDDPDNYTKYEVAPSNHKWSGHRFIHVRNQFDDKKHYLWPIPQREMDINENLVQNPNY